MQLKYPAFMIQGTGSDVGKSLVVAALCRHFKNQGLSVAPFKPQNMSNNAAVTPDGGEIGRAQAMQALACGISPSVHMNPVLLKPESGTGAQVVVRGQVVARHSARDWQTARQDYLPQVVESFDLLKAQYDLVIVEGAGSPAEINLRDGDIANMGFAEAVDTPVILVADIHRGGVIASVVGTHAVLPAAEQARIIGVIINNFHGDVSLFDDGVREIEQRTGWPVLGILPDVPEARALPAEDALALDKGFETAGTEMKVAALRFPRIANFDDLDTLRLDDRVSLTMVQPGQAIPGDMDWVILPGSKNTRSDLAALKAEGWDIDLCAHVHRGGRVLGICGGYQMLGRMIHDPDGVDGGAGSSEGLGLLNVETTMAPQKTVCQTTARHMQSGINVAGYEIHMGHTHGPDAAARPLFQVEGGTSDGAQSQDRAIMGTYLHGALDVRLLGLAPTLETLDHKIDQAFEVLASVMTERLELKLLNKQP